MVKLVFLLNGNVTFINVTKIHLDYTQNKLTISQRDTEWVLVADETALDEIKRLKVLNVELHITPVTSILHTGKIVKVIPL